MISFNDDAYRRIVKIGNQANDDQNRLGTAKRSAPPLQRSASHLQIACSRVIYLFQANVLEDKNATLERGRASLCPPS